MFHIPSGTVATVPVMVVVSHRLFHLSNRVFMVILKTNHLIYRKHSSPLLRHLRPGLGVRVEHREVGYNNLNRDLILNVFTLCYKEVNQFSMQQTDSISCRVVALEKKSKRMQNTHGHWESNCQYTCQGTDGTN